MRAMPTLGHHHAMMGMAWVCGGFPLYYDGMNEFYRLPLSNDISLLVLFAMMNAIVIFIRTKKAYRRSVD
jgi:hypothetical protein